MDVDSVPAVDLLPSPPISAAPTVTGFENLFYSSMSPARNGSHHRKWHSSSPEPISRMEQEGPSSPPPSSPSQHKFERIVSGSLLSNNPKPSLQGLGTPSQVDKRLRRPVFSALGNLTESTTNSICSIVDSDASPAQSIEKHQPTRRVVSAMLPVTGVEHHLSDESSFDGPDMSSPAQAYAQRQQVKTIRRRDGTEDFRPLTGIPMAIRAHVESPSAKFMRGGIPGFGDNETIGKILPCHRVREDGLMRIAPETVSHS